MTDRQDTSLSTREREGGMPDNDNRPDVGQLWRNWLTETERQWNGFFNDIFATDSFGRFLGGYVDVYSSFQRLATQNMERSLSALNLPTRSDTVDLSERLSSIEQRLASMESALNTLAEAVGHPTQSASVTQLRPRRTRRPRTQPSQAQ